MRVLALVAAAALAGCATTTPEPQTVYRDAPTPTIAKCSPTIQRPDFPDTDAALKAAPDDAFVQILQAGRLKRIPYIGQLEAALKGCGGKVE